MLVLVAMLFMPMPFQYAYALCSLATAAPGSAVSLPAARLLAQTRTHIIYPTRTRTITHNP